jgi:hypothetical protein
MSTTSTNGRPPRPSLATQLDRLDDILDGLADGLNEAVATAVKEAVAVAVAATLQELLTNAELQRRLRAEPAARPGGAGRAFRGLWRGLVGLAQGGWRRVATTAGRCRDQVAAVVTAVNQGQAAFVRRVRRGLTGFAGRARRGGALALALACQFRRPLLGALAIGALVGLGCYLAGPAVSAAVSGVAGFAGSLAAGILARLRRLLTGDESEEWRYQRVASTRPS